MSERLPTLRDNNPLPAAEVYPPQTSDEAWADAGDEGAAFGTGSTFSLRRVVLALRRYWWLVVLAGGLGLVGGVYSTTLVQPQYEATGTIWLETTSQAEEAQGPIQTAELFQGYSWQELLLTGLVLDPVVIAQRLYLSAPSGTREDMSQLFLQDGTQFGSYVLSVDDAGEEFVLATAEGVEVDRGAVGTPVGQEVGIRWRPGRDVLTPGRVMRFTLLNERWVTGTLGERLTSRMDQEGNVLHMNLLGPDPEEVTATLNAVMRQFETVAASLKRLSLDDRTEALKEQLDRAQLEVDSAEFALEAFKIATITLPGEERTAPVAPGVTETRDPVFGNFFNMQVNLDDLRRDRARVADILATPGEEIPVTQLELIPSVQGSSELGAVFQEYNNRKATLRAYLERYTEEYPPVQQEMQAIEGLESNTIPRQLGNLVAALDTRIGELDTRIEGTSRELRAIPTRTIQEARLQRSFDIASQQYQDVRQRYERARLAAASSVPDVRILDEAVVPQFPAEDSRLPLAMMIFGGLLAVGVAGAVFLDRSDDRFRYPEDVSVGLGLEILGTIPRVLPKGAGFDVQEAFRELRLRLMYAHGSAGPLMVAISSPGPEEGKTFIASNLALSFAETGRRTLLIDADTRRGDLHHILGVNRKPGLVDYLSGGRADGLIQKTEYPNLHVLGSGTRLARAPELLTGAQMQRMLGRLRSHYEVIIVDTPPMAAGADAFQIGLLTGAMAIVFRAGASDKALVEAKLRSLGDVPLRILGGILNDLSSKMVKSYGYYSSYYLPGYEAEDEQYAEDEEDTKALPAASAGAAD
ncbi:MAG: polysaccharide biosynthesis tyrosine autokinase [Gemmatimonadetes bacterium]|nr:polysaccharide biosynthesis tyrosine autokinase [Gemmatimonadota bacterium]